MRYYEIPGVREVMCDVSRPGQTFNDAITWAVRADSGLYVATVDGEGLSYEAHDQGTIPRPSLMVTPGERQALLDALQQVPPYQPSKSHLSDAIDVRDRMITLVEHVLSSSRTHVSWSGSRQGK